VLTGIGYVTALNSATVRSMITEPIVSIDFKDGQSVTKGELLAQLDPSTYQAQLDQAEVNLARDQAHLENGQINLSRYDAAQIVGGNCARGTVNLSGWVSRMAGGLAVGIGVYCQPMLQISAQTRNF
jgi:membrane fusion protein, multidrug efflux system